MDTPDIRPDTFPAKSKSATGSIGGVHTEATSTSFSDKLLVTVSQEGRLSQWVQIPLSAPSPALVDMAMPSAALGMLPANHLTPKTLLGGGGEDRETLGQLYAAQIGTHLARKDPDDRRTLVVGLGLKHLEAEREAFFDVLELVIKVL